MDLNYNKLIINDINTKIHICSGFNIRQKKLKALWLASNCFFLLGFGENNIQGNGYDHVKAFSTFLIIIPLL